jgi:hypothetical protein
VLATITDPRRRRGIRHPLLAVLSLTVFALMAGQRLQQAFDRSCGALSLGVDRERWRQAELDRLDWEASKTG